MAFKTILPQTMLASLVFYNISVTAIQIEVLADLKFHILLFYIRTYFWYKRYTINITDIYVRILVPIVMFGYLRRYQKKPTLYVISSFDKGIFQNIDPKFLTTTMLAIWLFIFHSVGIILLEVISNIQCYLRILRTFF